MIAVVALLRRLSLVGAVLAAVLAGGAAAAAAEEPLRADAKITDRAGALDPAAGARVGAAIGELRADTGVDLFVVYVEDFAGADGPSWAGSTARLSRLGREDVLLAVAVGERSYGVHVDPGISLSQSRIDDAITAAEDRLAADDPAGAAVALADGLRGGGGDVPVGALLVGGVAAAGGGAYLLSRRRRRAAAGPAEAEPTRTDVPRDEFSEVPTADLAYRASTALIEVDDAVRTSEQELAAARAHFGNEPVAGFAAALEQSRADMLAAFGIRQKLDDDEPEDEPAARALHGEIIRLCRGADERLDAQTDAFDRLRDLEARAPEFVAGLDARTETVAGRLPDARSQWSALLARYAPTALEPVAGHLDQAATLLAAARAEVGEAGAELAAGSTAAAVVSGRVAEDALTQAEALLDGVHRLGGELTDAAAQLPAARAEVGQDLAEATALGGDLVPVVARAEAAVAAAEQAADRDPVAALRLLREAGAALDAGIDEARVAHQRTRRAAAALDQALLTARAAVAAAEDFVGTRRGAVGGPARTRLAEARRHLQQAVAGGDPVVALREAQQADTRGQEALRLAQDDVSRWSGQGPGVPSGRAAGIGVDLGSLILGGIISGAVRGGGGFGGGFGGGGSFGGTSTRGRRGGGGRY